MPVSVVAFHEYPRAVTSMGSFRRSSESFVRPNAFGSFFSMLHRKSSVSAADIARRGAEPVSTRKAALRRSLVRRRSRVLGMSRGALRPSAA